MLDTYYERSCIVGTVGFRSKNMENHIRFLCRIPLFLFTFDALYQ